MSDNVDDPLLVNFHKRQRNSVNLKVKLDILKRAEAGQRGVDIAKIHNLPATTVRSIVAKSETIKKFAKSAISLSATKLTRQRNSLMNNMEGQLTEWLERKNECGMPPTRTEIQEKARMLYEKLKLEYGGSHDDVEPFIASRGWLDRFKKRSSLYTKSDEELVCEEEMVLSPVIEFSEYKNEPMSTSHIVKKDNPERSNKSDEFDAIASCVAAKLRKMNEKNENQRHYCERIINEALFRALMNKLTPNSIIIDDPNADDTNKTI